MTKKNLNGNPDMRYRRNKKLIYKTWLAKYWIVLILLAVAVGAVVNSTRKVNQEFLSPVPEKSYPIPWPVIKEVINVTVDEKCVDKTSLEPTGGVWEGVASYYSEAGCIGCSPTLTMANGERLDDNKPTVAFNKLPLGSMVRVINQDNNMFIDVEVTDTGGFHRHGKIMDLNLKAKKMLSCADTCKVKILEI